MCAARRPPPRHRIDLPKHLHKGQQLTLNGRVDELGKRRDTQTALRDISELTRCGESQPLPVTPVQLPLGARQREALENMRVDFSGDLVVTDVYHLHRGDFTVAAGGILPAPTEVARPGKAAQQQERANRDAQQRVRLAPGDTTRFAMGTEWLPDRAVLGHDGYNARLLLEEPVRIRPVSLPEVTATAPDSLRIVALNLENYFNGNGRGRGFPTPRGAETSAEFRQQRAQLEGLMGALQPGLLAVMELENDGNEKHSAANDLRADLNAGTGADWAIAAPRNEKLGSDQIDHCTFDTEPWSVKQKQAWFDAFQADNPYRLLVARAGSQLLGYAHSGAWRPKKAYQVTAETTVYLHPDAAGQGLGARLLRELLATLAAAGVERAVAGVAQPNPASDRLHAALGFARVGTFERVGHKFGRHWDVTWWQRDTRA